MEVIQVDQLTFHYPESTVAALDNITLNIKPGDFVVLCGASGCGKTTLLRHLKKKRSLRENAQAPLSINVYC